MKFLADMGISPKTVTFLQGLEQDVVHLHEVITKHQDALQQGVIISVTEGQIRVRLLPIETTK